MGQVPAFNPNLAPTEGAAAEVQPPDLLICSVSQKQDGGRRLVLPGPIRSKWSEDPARKAEWMTEIAQFDARPVSSSSGFRFKVQDLGSGLRFRFLGLRV